VLRGNGVLLPAHELPVETLSEGGLSSSDGDGLGRHRPTSMTSPEAAISDDPTGVAPSGPDGPGGGLHLMDAIWL
jgi:hypothetical protein